MTMILVAFFYFFGNKIKKMKKKKNFEINKKIKKRYSSTIFNIFFFNFKKNESSEVR